MNELNVRWQFNKLSKEEQDEVLYAGLIITELVNCNAISLDEILCASASIADYVTQTRFTDFNRLLFKRNDLGERVPRLLHLEK